MIGIQVESPFPGTLENGPSKCNVLLVIVAS